nr:mitochondrial ribonuclease P protein 1 homolog [Procambarus clarkii]
MMTSRVGPTLCAAARHHLSLQGRQTFFTNTSQQRLSSECARACWSSSTSSRRSRWVGMKMEHRLQLGSVKWYCTSRQQHTQSERNDGALKCTEEGHQSSSNAVTSTKEESQRSHDFPESKITKRENYSLNKASNRVDNVPETETDFIFSERIKEGNTEPTTLSEENEEVDLEELIKLEVELYRQEGIYVPSTFTPEEWQELLTIKSVAGRKRYLTFLFKIEMKNKNIKIKKELKKKIREENLSIEREEDDGRIHYGLWRNSIFLKILDSTMNHFYNSRVISAMMYGQPIVIDLGFGENMTSKERQNCADQIQMLIGENRIHNDPYAIHLCNADSSEDTMRRLQKFIPIMYKPEFPLIVTPESYVDKFPRDKLVYLTPHCHEELVHYDHDAVYIIGGIVDKTKSEPLTLAKAKRQGISMKKLPLDRYLSWGSGSSKSLTLNQVLRIMLDIKHTGNWQYSLRHVPRRKIKPEPTDEELEAMIRKRVDKQRRGKFNSLGRELPHRKYKMY